MAYLCSFIKNLPHKNLACFLYLCNMVSPTRKSLAAYKLLANIVTLFFSTFVTFTKTDLVYVILFLLTTL